MLVVWARSKGPRKNMRNCAERSCLFATTYELLTVLTALPLPVLTVKCIWLTFEEFYN